MKIAFAQSARKLAVAATAMMAVSTNVFANDKAQESPIASQSETPTSFSLGAIQAGDTVTEAEARKLSDTSGIVFFCGSDDMSRMGCSVATASINTRDGLNATWVTGLDRVVSAKLFICDKGGRDNYNLPSRQRVQDLIQKAEVVYSTLKQAGYCGAK